MRSANDFGFTRIVVLLGLLTCNACNRPEKLKFVGKGTELDLSIARKNLMQISEGKSLSNLNQCLYYQDFGTGNIMRVSLDGKIRELVIKCGIVRGMSLDHGFTNLQGPWQITMPCVPSPGGYSIIDRTNLPQLNGKEPYSPNNMNSDEEWSVQNKAFIAYSSKATPWSFRLHYGKFELEPGHFHSYLNKVEFESGTTSRVYEFKDRPLSRSYFAGMADQNDAIIVDYPNVFIWNLSNDERNVIANTMPGPVVWPRDLHAETRFNPVLKVRFEGENYSWRLHSPDDIRPKPEYKNEKKRQSIFKFNRPSTKQ